MPRRPPTNDLLTSLHSPDMGGYGFRGSVCQSPTKRIMKPRQTLILRLKPIGIPKTAAEYETDEV